MDFQDITPAVKDNYTALMRQRGWTPEQMAAHVQTSDQRLAAWLRSQAEPSATAPDSPSPEGAGSGEPPEGVSASDGAEADKPRGRRGRAAAQVTAAAGD